jgi:hypothetical protein
MSDTTDPRRHAAEALHAAVLEARRVGGDAAICDALHMLAAASGLNKFNSAAAIVSGRRLGRPAIDDAAALRRIAAFPPDRRREAVGVVAAMMAKASGKKVETIERRLRLKLAKN